MIQLRFSSVKMWESGKRKSHLVLLKVFSINIYCLVQKLASSSTRPGLFSTFTFNNARGMLRQPS